MTEKAETKDKGKIAFYIFTEDKEGNTTRAGTAFKHNTGKGINIVMGDNRFVAWPPKDKSQTSAPGG